MEKGSGSPDDYLDLYFQIRRGDRRQPVNDLTMSRSRLLSLQGQYQVIYRS